MTLTTVVLVLASAWSYPGGASKGAVAPIPKETAVCETGDSLVLTGDNVGWDVRTGGFYAKLKLLPSMEGGNAGDLYFNRDAGHSMLPLKDYPGLTNVTLDDEARARGLHRGMPVLSLPCPTFGNASMAMVEGRYWRSLPRRMMTTAREALLLSVKLYESNQLYVFPACWDCPPLGTNGDVFASIAPYWLVTQGRSWSDRPYLKAALEVSRTLRPEVKAEIVRRGLLNPTIQTLIRKSLRGVTNEVDYLTAKAHPTALPASGPDLSRLVESARRLGADEIPPLAKVKLEMLRMPGEKEVAGELTYATPYAVAVVLRSKESHRQFRVVAEGGDEYAFVQTHGDPAATDVMTVLNRAVITVDRSKVTPQNRVDVAVMAKSAKSGWGAPSYLSFAVVDGAGGYVDPWLAAGQK